MMNRTIKDILNRRSIRSFTEENIDENTLNLIIKAGLYAPSAHNQQSWHFTVIHDKDLIDEISNETKKVLGTFSDRRYKSISQNEKYHIFHNAPVVIFVSGEEKAMMPKEDCAAATQNMLIAAESLGIGSCWIGFARYLFSSENFETYSEKLGIPEGYKPYYAVVFGKKNVTVVKAAERRANTVNIIN